MTQFFRVPSDHALAKKTKAFHLYESQLSQIFNEFARQHEIKTIVWYPLASELKIIPTDEDKIKFKKELKVDGKKFKKNSPTAKAWEQATRDIIVARKPFLPFEFRKRVYTSKSWWSGFIDADGNYYIKVDSDGEYENSDFQEIQGSEYYIALEKTERK